MDGVSPPQARDPLLATKLQIPPLRAQRVARPQLLQRLSTNLERQITLVSAPAGYGKSTLVNDWVRAQNRPAAWLSLEEADGEPVRFLHYLTAALQQIEPSIGGDLPTILDAMPSFQADVGITLLINDLTAYASPCLLVLDDFHTIENRIVQEMVTTLVNHQPATLHLVLVTREDPPLPLARLRATGQLLEVRGTDLRFSLGESANFLTQVMGVTLSPPQLTTLDARMEGWIAGLQLAALSMQQRSDPGAVIEGISGAHHFILTYLTEEVLRELSPEQQSFLLETSILGRLTGGLCDAVTGREDGDTLLTTLHTSNAFVLALDEEKQWYRYHHLFADLLRSRLDVVAPGRAAELHQRASAWYAAKGMATEAIDHAFAAADFVGVVQLLEEHARAFILQGHAQLVHDWLQRLPDDWRMAGPRANLAFAWSLLLGGRVGEVERYLRSAEEHLLRANVDEIGRLQAEILSLRSALVALSGETASACNMAAEAVTLAADGDAYTQGITRFCLATAYNYDGRTRNAIDAYQDALPLCQQAGNRLAAMLIVANLGMLYIVQGRLRAADDLCRRTLEMVHQAGESHVPALTTIHGIHCEIRYEQGNWDGLHENLTRWLNLSQRSGHAAALAYGKVLAARIAQSQGDLSAARRALEEAEAMRHLRTPAWVTTQIIAQLVSLALAEDDLAQAAHVLTTTGIAADAPPHHSYEVIQIAHLRLLIQRFQHTQGTKDAVAATTLAARLLDAAESAGRMGRVLDVLLLRAQLHAAQDDERAALADLQRAVDLAAPEGYVQRFVNAGPSMAALLRQRQRRTHIPYIETLLTAFPSSPSSLIEPLSERELDVLRLMAEGLTYQEVADRLIVSVNTVRFHVKSLYGKLGVDKRIAAVDRARELGLLN